MHRKKKLRNIIILVLVILVFSLSVAYAGFYQVLTINGSVKLLNQGTWDLAFENISSMNTTGYATGTRSRDETEKNIVFSCEFVAYGDSCSFTANLSNRGTIDAVLKSYEIVISENGAEVYRGTDTNFSDETITVDFTNNLDVNSNLLAGNKKEVGISVVLKPDAYAATTDNYSIRIAYNFEQVPK